MKPLRVFLVGLALLLCMAGVCSAVTYDPYEIQPKLPMGIGGTVFIDGELAPVGTVITATGQNVGIGFIDNPLTLDRNPFGGFCQFKLMIQGTPLKWSDPTAPAGQWAVPDGSPITILVDNEPAKIRVSGSDTWSDTIAWESGAVITVEIALSHGSDPLVPEPKKMVMTTDTYSSAWDPTEQAFINNMKASRFYVVRNLAGIVDGLRGNWWNPHYSVNWDAVNRSPAYVQRRIARQIAYAEAGGYVESGPDLMAMLDAQNWKQVRWYGVKYPVVGWTRWDLDQYRLYNPPSLYIPPSDKGYIDSISTV